jgi:hypothetical protein
MIAETVIGRATDVRHYKKIAPAYLEGDLRGSTH